ncbi:hypothetical protein FOZ62_014248, partial [Perkinsus olseni]
MSIASLALGRYPGASPPRTAPLRAGKQTKRSLAVTSVAEADHDALQSCVSAFIRNGHAASTQAQYDSIESFYVEMVAGTLPPYPVSGRGVATFAWGMCKAEYKYSTISSYISAVISKNSSYGYSLSKAEEFQIKMTRRAAEKLSDVELRQVPPLSREQVRQLGEINDPTVSVFTDIILTAIYGLLRSEEALALNREDVSFDLVLGVEVAVLKVRASKTDQAGKGETVIVSCVKDSPAASHCEPHCAYHRLRLRSRADPTSDGALFAVGG